jgi:hypothetical protein
MSGLGVTARWCVCWMVRVLDTACVEFFDYSVA